MKRILLAGILGGVAMFVWSSVAHMMLPLGAIGIRDIPNEQPALSALNTAIGGAAGMYMFPGFGLGPNATHEQRQAAMQDYAKKTAVSPSGMIIYHPPGRLPMAPSQLITEFLTELLEALLVAYLLSKAALSSFGGRVMFVTLAGIMAAVTTNIPYWNWYGFPSNYTASYMTIEIVAYLAAGLVMAMVLKPAGITRLEPVAASGPALR